MRLEQQELEMAELRSELSARELWEVENYLRKQGVSVFIYDEPIDVFRFPEDGRFAFCDAFADWERLQERGYLLGTFTSEVTSIPSSASPGPIGTGLG